MLRTQGKPDIVSGIQKEKQTKKLVLDDYFTLFSSMCSLIAVTQVNCAFMCEGTV